MTFTKTSSAYTRISWDIIFEYPLNNRLLYNIHALNEAFLMKYYEVVQKTVLFYFVLKTHDYISRRVLNPMKYSRIKKKNIL